MADAEGAPKGGSKNMIIMAAVAVLLMIGVGAGGYFLGHKSGGGAVKEGGAAPAAEEAAPSGGEGGGEGGAAAGNLVEFNDVIVNLLDDQEPRYLKAAITLEMTGPAAVADANAHKAQIKDAIILLLSNKTLLELRDMQGKLQLRADLMEKINSILPKGKVKTLYFTDFIVQ